MLFHARSRTLISVLLLHMDYFWQPCHIALHAGARLQGRSKRVVQVLDGHGKILDPRILIENEKILELE